MTESRERYSYARLHGRWLLLAQGVWFALVVLTLAIFFASLPVYLAQLQTICIGTYGIACTYPQLSPEQAEALKGMGLSIGNYAASMVALMLVTFGPIIATSSVSASPSPWQVPNACLTFLALALLVLVFSVFPTGQFAPSFTRWTAVVSLAVQVPYTFFPNAPFTLKIHADTLGHLVLLGEGAILVAVQLSRYRRVSSPLQRQQTKWVVFGFTLPITVYLGGTLLYLIFPALNEPSPYQLALNAVFTCLLLLIPLSFGFAMLRNRLWEIDVLINRTLVYGALTVILTLVYAGLVIGLQALLHGIISQDSGVAIVISTLAIAALFQPLRKRIQRIIDRRFYHSKYDSAQIIEAFSATLRNEVDLDQLREHLLALVAPTSTRRDTEALENHSSWFF